MLAYDFPLLGLFWTIFILFLWVAWIMLLFRVFGDIFRNDEIGGFAKALWSIFVIVAPFLGVFVYVMANGSSMTRRDIANAQVAEAQFQSYVRSVASETSAADELAKLAELKASGVITDAEFDQQKAKLLG